MTSYGRGKAADLRRAVSKDERTDSDRTIELLTAMFNAGASTRAVAQCCGVSQTTASRWRRALRNAESLDSAVTTGAAVEQASERYTESDDACSACALAVPPRRYCSNACRQRAYRQRKAEEL